MRQVQGVLRAVTRLLFPAPLLEVPERGIRRKITAFIGRELRTNTGPFRASLSLALGVFMAILPIHGLQVITLLALSFPLRLNRPLALLGVSVSSAPFLPFWIAAGVAVGDVVVPSTFAASAATALGAHLPGAALSWISRLPIRGLLDGVVTWFFGSIVLAAACGAAALCAGYPILRRFKAAKENDCTKSP